MEKVYIVYSNVFELLSHRGLTAVTKKMSTEQFATEINNAKYLEIVGRAANGETTVVCFIAPNQRIHETTSEFRSLESVFKSAHKRVLIMAPRPYSNNVNNALAAIRNKNWLSIGGEPAPASVSVVNSTAQYIENFTYQLTTIVVPRHVMVPKHELATAEEIENELKRYRLTPNNLPMIERYDPPVAWLGLRPGDICKITRVDDLSGETIIYRLVI